MKELIRNAKVNFCIKITAIALICSTTGCEKYLDIPLPAIQVAGDGGFITNASTGSVLSGVFYSIINSSYPAGSGIGYDASLYTDELMILNPNAAGNVFYTDNIQSPNILGIWNDSYKHVYACNQAIAGINNSQALLTNKNQYLGEAYFTRAWIYFNLVNMFGGVPLALTTDPAVTNKLARSSVNDVYAQIISDLTTAQGMLSDDYRDAIGSVTTSRARPNRVAVNALLARVYLYTSDWANAEKAATAVISNTNYKLTTLSQAFTAANNTEMIWGLTPTGASYVADYNTYNNNMPSPIPAGKTVQSYSVSVALSNSAVANFEPNDQRLAVWVRAILDPASNKTYYFPNKYKANVNGVESVVVLRLAEVYLIRAEARARQNNLNGAQADLNLVRTRAGLGSTAAATQSDLISAVLKERRSELFTEMGHRFFDLKRTGTIDAVMNVVAPTKGATWTSQKQLWPISSNDIVVNPNLVQNPGYN